MSDERITQRTVNQWAIGDLVTHAIDTTTNGSDRSRQAKANVLGVSDIGNCHEYVRRMIVGEEPSQEVHKYDLAAFIGTAVGDHLEDAIIAAQPDAGWVKQDEVILQLEVRGFVLNIPGHPDIYTRRDLIDLKTKDGVGVQRRGGASIPERYQRHGYAYALIKAGKMDEDCWVHNVYVDRSGADPEPVVVSEPFSMAVIEEMIEWLDDVMYAVQMDEEAMRDPNREWCWACCPFAPQCRGFDDSDVEGRITDPFVIEAVKVYKESAAQIAALEKDKKSAASVLRDVSGATDEWKVRWIDIGPADIPASHRAGYSRLDIRPVGTRPARKRKASTDEG